MTKQSKTMPILPSWSVYGNYSSNNYGAHALRFDVGGNSFWFSYKTLVAFQKSVGDCVVHQNVWGTTTGKHLNAIDGGNKKHRLNAANFEAAFVQTFGRSFAVA